MAFGFACLTFGMTGAMVLGSYIYSIVPNKAIFQFPTESEPGQSRPPLVVPPSVTDHQGLPESYVTVPAVALNTSSVSVPAYSTTPLHGNVSLDGAIQQEGR